MSTHTDVLKVPVMGWFSKTPANASLDEIVKIVVTDTDKFIDDPDNNSIELSFFSKIPETREMWRSRALEKCYKIANFDNLDHQAIATREALLEVIDFKFLHQQYLDEKLGDEERNIILDHLVIDSVWEIEEDDPDRYKKKVEVWAANIAMAHADTLAFITLAKHFEESERVQKWLEMYIDSAKIFSEFFATCAIERSQQGEVNGTSQIFYNTAKATIDDLKNSIIAAK